jgi:hypothetical protein
MHPELLGQPADHRLGIRLSIQPDRTSPQLIGVLLRWCHGRLPSGPIGTFLKVSELPGEPQGTKVLDGVRDILRIQPGVEVRRRTYSTPGCFQEPFKHGKSVLSGTIRVIRDQRREDRCRGRNEPLLARGPDDPLAYFSEHPMLELLRIGSLQKPSLTEGKMDRQNTQSNEVSFKLTLRYPQQEGLPHTSCALNQAHRSQAGSDAVDGRRGLTGVAVGRSCQGVPVWGRGCC